ncbi:MAG: hypothetical protein MJE66_16655, partial [Proteobacteria bacterium]|nr:hypothetical protein [Pseudomonadota bacterium]
GRVRAYRDRSVFNEITAQASVKAACLRIPLAPATARGGDLRGRFYDLTPLVESDPEAAANAIDALVRRSDFSDVEERLVGVDIESDFRQTRTRTDLLGLFRRARVARSDDVRVHGNGETERFLQAQAGGSGFWVFLDHGEDHRFRIQAVAPRVGEGAAAPTLVARYSATDRDTRSSELAGHLSFVNGLASERDEPLIDFTPSEHTINGRWGHLRAGVELRFSPAAVETLLASSRTDYWETLRELTELDQERFDRYRRWLAERGKRRILLRRRVPLPYRKSIRYAASARRRLEAARDADSPRKRLTSLLDAFVEASYLNATTYDPAVLATLRRVGGIEEVSVAARITQPPWREPRLVGKVDLVGRTHRKPIARLGEAIDLDPSGPSGLYQMLDHFPWASELMEPKLEPAP